MSFTIIGSSYTSDVYTFYFEGDSLALISSVEVGFHPSWIAFHPEDRSLIFAGLEQDEGKIIAIKYDAELKGAVVAESSSGGKDPCSVVVVKDELLIANYSSGSISTLPVSQNAPYILADTPISTITLSGSGPNQERQLSPHTHQVIYIDEYNEILVPDLGGDRVYRLKKDAKGTWSIAGHIDHEAGSGPRHVAVHDGYLYTLLELKSSIAKHSFPRSPTSDVKFIAKTPTMYNPPPLPNDMLAAEILIPKPNATFTTPYVYVSNRNHPSPEGDSVAIFSIEKPDAPELIAEVRTGLRHLRGMEFGGPDDMYLCAGGLYAGGVRIFERTEGGRNLKLVAQNSSIKSPTGFLWV
ncbi:MAG: Lactonase, 7-bladed beta-propeller-domain-containing protein [Lentinula lateritia]|uniref:Isomerase YbhE n=1 Tax=Lentinula lateritia TaxID=40482 RepID=A0ABQ8VGF8_9AGAR|nr:MAG: Lactonase, 7-bladed beta-propeller-domain-containing protein [Lentinula lateritia]KAJ4485124.1 putative isomerase YbhE [Lentinula lateritia]